MNSHNFLMFLLLMTSANASLLSEHKIMLFYSMILTVLLVLKGKKCYVSYVIIGILILALYICGYFIKFRIWDVGFMAMGINWTAISIGTLAFFRKRQFLQSFVNVLTFLAIVSLLLYPVLITTPNILVNALDAVDDFFHISAIDNGIRPGYKYANVLFYTVTNRGLGTGVPIRNYGFTWEPGAFAGFLGLAFLIQLYLTNKVFSKKSLILLLTILTTFSTTGYLIVLLGTAYYLISRQGPRKAALLSSMIIFIMLVFIVDLFLPEDVFSSKIRSLYISGTESIKIASRGYAPYSGQSSGRILGLWLGWKDFLRHPVIGLGVNPDLQYSALILGTEIGQITGLGALISRYGLIGIILTVYFFVKSRFALQRIYPGLFNILILGIFVFSGAFGFILTPTFYCFMLIFLCKSDDSIRISG